MYNNYFFFPLSVIFEPDYKVRKNTETRYNAFNNPHKGQIQGREYFTEYDIHGAEMGAGEKTKTKLQGSVMYRDPNPPPWLVPSSPTRRKGLRCLPLIFIFLLQSEPTE